MELTSWDTGAVLLGSPVTIVTARCLRVGGAVSAFATPSSENRATKSANWQAILKGTPAGPKRARDRDTVSMLIRIEVESCGIHQ